MSDAREHDGDALDEGALLAAYLDGETDDITTRRLERRLADDPALAARLDAVATTRAQLQRLAQVTMPDDMRRRLHAHLEQERTPATPAATPATRRRWWSAGIAPVAAAAAVLLVAVIGVASLAPLFVGGGEEAAVESAGTTDEAAPEAAPRLQAEADAAEDQQTAGAAGGEPSAEDPGAPDTAGAGRDGVGTAPVTVEGDAEIAARAERLLEDPPTSLRARERRLRRRAGLPAQPSCVADLEASTVDLVDEDGRLALAVLLDGDAEQIVLLDPQTCAPIRTVSTGR